MAIEDFFNHRCSIYHLQETTTSPGYGLPGTTSYSYPTKPDIEHLPCHFNLNAGTDMQQEQPYNEYLYTGKLNLPAGTDIRVNDKIVREDNGLEFYALPPENVRGHHMVVKVQRKGGAKSAL